MFYYYGEFWRNYVTFSGRSNRAAFWYVFLINLIIGLILYILQRTVNLPSAVGDVYSLAVLLPTIALDMRRMHDIGKSGGWVFIQFIPVVGTIIFLIWAARVGVDGPNQYGEAPAAAVK